MKYLCCVYSLESPHRGDSNVYTQHTIIVKEIKNTPQLSLFASWPGTMINPQWARTTHVSNNFLWSQRCSNLWSSTVDLDNKMSCFLITLNRNLIRSDKISQRIQPVLTVMAGRRPDKFSQRIHSVLTVMAWRRSVKFSQRIHSVLTVMAWRGPDKISQRIHSVLTVMAWRRPDKFS